MSWKKIRLTLMRLVPHDYVPAGNSRCARCSWRLA